MHGKARRRRMNAAMLCADGSALQWTIDRYAGGQMATTSDIQWTVAVDMAAAKTGIEQLTALLGIYYRAVLRETGNQEMSEKLTLEYQRIVLGTAFGPKKE